MEIKSLIELKTLLAMLVDAGATVFEGFGLKIAIPMKTFPAANIPVVPKDPIQQQLAEKHPLYNKAFPQGFPTHDSPKV